MAKLKSEVADMRSIMLCLAITVGRIENSLAQLPNSTSRTMLFEADKKVID